jgi:hypothetical protein
LATFRISPTGNDITCYLLKSISAATIRHLLLDQVLPRCLAHQGRLMIHASAVALEPGFVLFMGDSGSGKSTLAGEFHRAGQPVVADDCLWIKDAGCQIESVPSYGGLRLWPDSLEHLFSSWQQTTRMAHYTPKRRLALREGATSLFEQGRPALAMLVLSPLQISSGVILERLSPRDAFIAVLKQTFQLDLTDLERVSRHAQALGCIIPRLKAFRLSLPHDYALLPLVRQKILDTVL